MNKPRVTAEVLPLKERKILGAESDSLEEVSAPDDRATQASSPHTAAHNILLLLVIRWGVGGAGVQELTDGECQTIAVENQPSVCNTDRKSG